MVCDGSRRGVDLCIICGGARDRYRSVSVACWLVSRGRWDSEGHFSWWFSVCRLRSQYVLSEREYFYRGVFAIFKFKV